MLGKLLKYDLRANLKIFLFIWPAIVVFSLLERLLVALMPSSSPIAQVLIIMTIAVFMMALVAACIFSLVISVIRFYSGLLRDEGYLMFTLPVKTWQLVLSKLISAFVFVFGTALLSVLGGYCLLDALPNFSATFFTTIRYIVQGSDENVLILVLAAVNFVLSPIALLLQVYFSCSIGHLGKRLRVLWSILTFYGVSVVMQIVNTVAIVVIPFGLSDKLALTEIQTAVLTQGFTCIESIALCVVFFFVSERILRRHLNLE